MKMPRSPGSASLLLTILMLTACSSAYYKTMEGLGIEKRDILVDRVEAARDSQQDAAETFRDALSEFKAVVGEPDEALAERYERLRDAVNAGVKIGVGTDYVGFEIVDMARSMSDGVTFSNAIDPDLGIGDDGGFYTWTVAEVDSVLSAEEADAVATLLVQAVHVFGREAGPAGDHQFEMSIEEQAAAVRDSLGGVDGPVLMGGDFNTVSAYEVRPAAPRLMLMMSASPNAGSAA